MDARTRQPKEVLLPLMALFLSGLACTSKPGPASPAVAESSSSPSPRQTLAPSATRTPPPPIQFISWPEQGNLLLPPAVGVTFEASLDDLPPGGYVLTWDSLAQVIQAVSFDPRHVTVLAKVPDTNLSYGLDPTHLGGSTYVSPVSGEDRSLWVFDLEGKRTWRLADPCDTILGSVSPTGRYFLSSCDHVFTPGVSSGYDVFEVISVADGTGFRVALPSKDDRNRALLSWFGEDELIASRVWIDGRFAVCLIDVGDRTARCPDYFEHRSVMPKRSATGEYVAFEMAQEGPRVGLIAPRTCLTQDECDGIVELGEIAAPLLASPSGRRMLLFGGSDPNRVLAGFLEPPGWEVESLMEINGSYVFDAWCPDETCVLIMSAETPFPVYRLDPDGTLTFYPYDNIIASFNIP